MRLLIAGGAGYVGSALLPSLLARGDMHGTNLQKLYSISPRPEPISRLLPQMSSRQRSRGQNIPFLRTTNLRSTA